MKDLNSYRAAILVFLTLGFASCNKESGTHSHKGQEQVSLVDFVNPLMGTDSKYSLSNGNTYPAIATLHA